MSKSLREFVIVALSMAALAMSATAQQQKASANWANLNSLARGSEIRVSLVDGRIIRGFLQSVTSDSLAINAATSQETLLRKDVKRVQLKRQGHRGRNTLIGLAVGAAGGLAAGAGADRSRADSWFPNAGKQILTPTGMVIGTVVGVAIPTGGWRQIYRAP
jgi:hypothetical protein